MLDTPTSDSTTLKRQLHGQPDEEETPTNEQVSALPLRLAVQLPSPFADCAVGSHLTLGRPAELTGFSAYLPQPDWSWLPKEIPGPSNCSSLAHQRKIEKFAMTVALSLAPCLSSGRQVQVRTLQPAEIADRVPEHHSRPARTADVRCVASLVSHFPEGSGGRRALFGRQHSAPSDELPANMDRRGAPNACRASGCGSLARPVVPLRLLKKLRLTQGAVSTHGSRHIKQSERAPERE